MMRTPVRFVRLAVPLLLALGCAPQVTAPRLPAGTASSETMLGVHVERLAEVSAIGAMAQNETRREAFPRRGSKRVRPRARSAGPARAPGRSERQLMNFQPAR